VAPWTPHPGAHLRHPPFPAPFGSAGCYVPGTEIRYSAGNLAVPATTIGSYGDGGLGYAAMGYAPVVIVPYPYTGAMGGGLHPRFPYYSYRRPWYYDGPASTNVNIDW
jgi:hypothetical protein